MRDLQALVDLSGLSAEAAAAMRADPFPYGIAANRAELEAITQYSFEQGLTPRKLALDEVFYPPMLNL
jgi:4,5-dihydroxyphthalate decarboxylase